MVRKRFVEKQRGNRVRRRFLQRQHRVWRPICIGNGLGDQAPGNGLWDLDFTGVLKIVKVNISSQSKESRNLSVEAM